MTAPFPTHGDPATTVRRRVAEYAPQDAAAIAEMFNGSSEGWPDGFTGDVPMTAEMVVEMQRDRGPRATFIAWEGDSAAGYCSLYEHPAEPGTAGYVGLLNAATRFHGRGHGRDLLKAALARCIALGYRRVDLDTWEGNMKAVPLYKKTGYFWVPDTAVSMENYLPLLLGLPVLADFWAEADWYTSYVRDLSVQEDRSLDGKMRVYPYTFRHGDRFVRATIDATARGLTALETERWRLSCRVDDRRLIVGRLGTVRWEIENRTGRPLPVTLVAQAGEGLQLAKEETVVVEERFTTEAPLRAAAYRTPAFGRSVPCVESLVMLDGQPIRLETGVEIKQPFETRWVPARRSLLAGRAQRIDLQLKSNVAEPIDVQLMLAPSPALDVTVAGAEKGKPRLLDLTLDAEGYVGAALTVTAQQAGAHEIEVRATATIGDDHLDVAPVALPLPAVVPGSAVALTADAPRDDHAERDVWDREVRIETAMWRLVVALRQGSFSICDAATDDTLASGQIMVGPPFSWTGRTRLVHEATTAQHDGSTIVVLRGRLPHLPAIVAEHALALSHDGLVTITTTVTNGGSEPRDVSVLIRTQSHLESTPMSALPTTHGLIVTADPEFPDWNSLPLEEPGLYAESWIARQGGGHVVGVIWSEARRVQAERWTMAGVTETAGELAPGERRVLPPLALYAGPGDWETVRGYWRALLRPDAPEHAPAPRDVVLATGDVVPAAVVAGRPNRLQVTSVSNRDLAGQLRFDVPAGWELSPTTVQVTSLSIDQAATVEVTARHGEQRPGAAPLRALLRSERLERPLFDGALLDLGSGGAVRVTETAINDRRQVLVDNGYLRFRIVPDFVGSVVAIETVSDGVNHLLSAYPTPREFGWLRPWYGGLFAVVYRPGLGGPPSVARLFDEQLAVEEATEPGSSGQTWRGVAVHSQLQSSGLHGLELGVRYLTLPGSNLVATELSVRNATTAAIPIDAAVVAFLQPGGSVDGVELLTDTLGERQFLRARRTDEVGADAWVGVRQPQSGVTVAMVAAGKASDAHLVGVDWGGLGAHAALRLGTTLRGGERRAAWAFLAIARDVAEARAYRALASCDVLP